MTNENVKKYIHTPYKMNLKARDPGFEYFGHFQTKQAVLLVVPRPRLKIKKRENKMLNLSQNGKFLAKKWRKNVYQNFTR